VSSLFNNILFVISSIIISFSELFVCSRLYRIKINYKGFWFYLSLILMTSLGILNYFYVNAFIKMFFSLLLFGVSNWFVFRQLFNRTLVCTLYTYFLMTMSDIFGVLFVMFILKIDIELLKANIFGSLIGNLVPSILIIILCYLPFIKKIYLKLVNLTDKIKLVNLIKFCGLSFISINFLLIFMYYELNSVYVIIINTVLLLIYSYIVYRTLNERNNSLIVKAENDSLMESLHQYEDMVDRQRVDNHENKNQLLIIKNMINKKDKDVVKYIDTIVKDQKEDDEALYTRVMTIPSGGLQGIIYQKMLVMKDENILFSLDVSRDVRKIELDNFSMEDNYRLCKIVGVLLDNAIEESRKIDDKRIMISLYVDDDKLVIDISNRFEGNIDIDKLDLEGYTTKSDGHGYGLSLVKKILSESDIFENERSIKKDVFKQVVKVKIKNT